LPLFLGFKKVYASSFQAVDIAKPLEGKVSTNRRSIFRRLFFHRYFG